MQLKRVLAVLLAIITVSGVLLVACGNTTDNTSSVQVSASSSVQGGETAPASGTDSNISGVNEFPIVKEQIQLKIATPARTIILDFDDNEQTKHLEEHTNIDIVWDILPETGYTERVNLMIAGGAALPDVFSQCGAAFPASMQATLGAQGIIAPLNDLIEKWKYNITGWQEYYPTAMTQLTAPDGNIYSLPTLGPPNPANDVAQRFWINKDFMDALGITKIPETTEELRDYLLAVKNGDPNGNGKPDELPLAAAGPVGGTNQGQIDGFLMQPFIYCDSNNGTTAEQKRRIYMTPDAKVNYAPVQDGWREALKYLNSLYNDGLITTEAFTLGNEELRALIEFEDAMTVGSLPGLGFNVFANVNGERRKAYVAVPPLKGPDGTQQSWWAEYSGVNIGAWVLPTAGGHKDEAIKLVDYIYTEEMWFWARYGVEGRDWKVPDVGVKAWDGDQAKLEVLPGAAFVYGEPQRVNLAGRIPQWGRYGSGVGVDDGDPFNLERILWDAHLLYLPYRTEKQVPPLFYTEEEAKGRTEMANTLHQAVELSIAEFTTGARDINSDADWSAYIQELKDIGYEKVLEYDQTAFDRQWAETWKQTHKTA